MTKAAVTDDLMADEVRAGIQHHISRLAEANVDDPEMVARVTAGMGAAMAQWMFNMLPAATEDQLVEIAAKQLRSFLRQIAEANPEQAAERVAPISSDWRALLADQSADPVGDAAQS